MESKVSVIVPVFRVEAYLPTCVDSILGQTYRNIELILVDDGSDDGCPAMCDAYAAADARVRCIHKQNGGQAFARRDGVAVATGDYFLFADSDDWLEPDAIERFVRTAEVNKADVVCSGYRRVYRTGHLIRFFARRKRCMRVKRYARFSGDLSVLLRMSCVLWRQWIG